MHTILYFLHFVKNCPRRKKKKTIRSKCQYCNILTKKNEEDKVILNAYFCEFIYLFILNLLY